MLRTDLRASTILPFVRQMKRSTPSLRWRMIQNCGKPWFRKALAPHKPSLRSPPQDDGKFFWRTVCLRAPKKNSHNPPGVGAATPCFAALSASWIVFSGTEPTLINPTPHKNRISTKRRRHFGQRSTPIRTRHAQMPHRAQTHGQFGLPLTLQIFNHLPK